MRTLVLGTLLAICFAALASAEEGPVSCETLNAALRGGDSVEDVARDYDTTRARVAACARIAANREKAAAREQRVAEARAARSVAP